MDCETLQPERCVSSKVVFMLHIDSGSDTPQPVARKIIEQYSNDAPFSDGEIFWKIRTYHKKGNAQAERRWWARLSEAKKKDVKQLLGDSQFEHAFDSLLDFPALWPPIKLGTLHRFHSLKCKEVRDNFANICTVLR